MRTRMWNNNRNRRRTNSESLFNFPKIEVIITKDFIIYTLEIPGITEEDIILKIENNKLLINGERKKDENNTFYNEINYGTFSREINLYDNTDINTVKSEYKNGILKIFFKKIKLKK